jgi:MFS family permease
MARGAGGYFAGLSRNTFLLALGSLFSDVSTEMLYPVLPVFLTQVLGAGGEAVGLVEGVAVAMQNLVQGVSGSLSDRLGRRKPIAMAGATLSAISKPLIGLSTAWPGVLGGRALDRLGAGVRSAPRDALIAASVDEAHRGKAFGLEGLGDNAGAFLGPLLAVLLLTVFKLDLRLIFYLAVIPGLLAVVMIGLVSEGPPDKVAAKAKTGRVRFTPAYRRYVVATAVFGLGNSSNAFLILQTRALGASLSLTILIYAAFNLVAALVSYPAGALSDRLGRKALLLSAYAVFFIAYLGFAFTGSLALIGGLFILYGLFAGIYRATGKALAADLVEPDVRASGVGWYGTAVGLSGLVASLIAGRLWDRVGHGAVFLFGAVMAVVGALALVTLVPNKSRA